MEKTMGGALAAVLTLGIMPAPAQAEETGGQTDIPAPVPVSYTQLAVYKRQAHC